MFGEKSINDENGQKSLLGEDAANPGQTKRIKVGANGGLLTQQGNLDDELDKAAVRGLHTEQASLTASALNANVVASVDVRKYAAVSLQLAGTFVASVQLQASNDGVNFIPIFGNVLAQSSWTTTLSGTAIVYIPPNFRYFRARVTSYTSGTINGTLELFGLMRAQHAMLLGASTAGIGVVTSILTATRSTIKTSALETTSGSSAVVTTTQYREALVTLNVTAASAPTSLAVKIQVSDDGGTTWYDHPDGSFTTAAGVTSEAKKLTVFGDSMRAAWTLSGTSFTFALKAVFK